MCPLLKKPFLDPSILDNFCLVFHLSFLGKMVEKVVALQLQRSLKEMDYLDTFQSGFRPGHGTKAALVSLLDDLCRSGMELSVTSWWLWYLFGMTSGIGVIDIVLCWFTTFLWGWSQLKLILRERSSSQCQLWRVLQGSMLSPLLFNIYMKPLGEILHHYRMRAKWVMHWIFFHRVWKFWGPEGGTTDFIWTLIRWSGYEWAPLYPGAYNLWFWMDLHYPRQIWCVTWWSSWGHSSCLKSKCNHGSTSCCVPVTPFPGEGNFPLTHSCLSHLPFETTTMHSTWTTLGKHLETS